LFVINGFIVFIFCFYIIFYTLQSVGYFLVLVIALDQVLLNFKIVSRSGKKGT